MIIFENQKIIPLKFNYNCVKPNGKCSERYIEIPLALWFMTNVIKNNPVLELGCTLPYYIEKDKNHIVYDLTDNHPDNIKKDIRLLTDNDYKTNIISISTLEHINQNQYGIRTIDNSFSAVYVLKKIMQNALKFFITVPIGQNKTLDEYLLNTNIGQKFIGRLPLKTNNWEFIDKMNLTREHLVGSTWQDADCICLITKY